MEGSGNSASKPIAKVFEEVCEGENVRQDVPNETAIGSLINAYLQKLGSGRFQIMRLLELSYDLRGRCPIIVQFEGVIRHQG